MPEAGLLAQGRDLDLGNPSADLLDTIHRLTRIAAPTGNEDRLTAGLAGYLRRRGLDPVVDRLGQVAVTVGQEAARGPVLMVSAHIDELGLTVTSVEAGGWLRMHRLGGVPERVLPGTRVVVHTKGGDLPGLVGLKSHHLTPPEERYIAKPATELYLDLGAGNREEAISLGVRVGDPVTYAPSWEVLAGGRFSAKALDDRVGVAALLVYLDRVLDDPPSGLVHVCFSAQEEFNVRGTLALATRFRPDIAVNVDIVPATDTPDLSGQGAVRVGGGPVLSRLSFHGRGTLGGLVPHPALVGAVEEAADSAALALQYDATVGIITDAAFLPMATAEGIAAVAVAIPARYTHSPVETAQLSDVEGCVDLLVQLTGLVRTADLNRGTPQIMRGGMA